MNILIVGSFDHWNGLEKHYIRFLTPLVDKIELYPFPDLIRDHFQKNILQRFKYRFKIFTQQKIDYLNEKLFEEVKNKRPDVVWIFKGVDILPLTLSKIKGIGVKLINYNADHPFIRTFRSSGGKEIEECLPYYDIVFCYSKDLIREISLRYQDKVKTEFLPFGYGLDIAEQDKLRLEGSQQEEILKACF